MTNLKRNDVHDYNFNIQVRIVGNTVMVSKGDKLIAVDKKSDTANPTTRKTADLFYKKHILETYDDANKITAPYKDYYPEYSPQPGMMIRVIKVDIGFGLKSKCLVAPTGYPTFKRIWVPKGKKVITAIKENF